MVGRGNPPPLPRHCRRNMPPPDPPAQFLPPRPGAAAPRRSRPAPVVEHGWGVGWSSEAPDYGGHGTPPLETTEGWRLAGRAAVLLTPVLHHELAPVGPTLAPA